MEVINVFQYTYMLYQAIMNHISIIIDVILDQMLMVCCPRQQRDNRFIASVVVSMLIAGETEGRKVRSTKLH